MIRRVSAVLAPTALVGALLSVCTPAPLEAACLPAEPVAFTPVPVTDAREAFALQSGSAPGGGPLWSAVALRTGSTHVLTLFNRPADGLPPTCFSIPLMADVSGGSTIALIAGRDSSRTVPGPFVDIERVSGTAGGTLHFARAFDAIVPGAPPMAVALGADEMVALWHCPIAATGNYTVELAPTSGFGWDIGVVNWDVSPGNWFLLATQGPDTTLGLTRTFVAAAGGDVLIAVIKAAAHSGTATLTVRSPTVEVGDGVGSRTRLVGIAPNPSFGSARVSFETAEAGEATIRVVDVAGRQVAQERIAVGAAGPQRFELSRLAGGRLAAGLYFVSLEFAGRAVGTGRVVVLEGGR